MEVVAFGVMCFYFRYELSMCNKAEDSIARAKEISHAMLKVGQFDNLGKSRVQMMILWRPPYESWVNVNTYCRLSSRSFVVGVIRDCCGNWNVSLLLGRRGLGGLNLNMIAPMLFV